MWLSPLMASLAVCVLLVDSFTNRELELKFQLRTPGEWEREWHQERFSRCRDSITRHLHWACEKDIYKLKRSTRKRAGNIGSVLHNDRSSIASGDGVNLEEFWLEFPWKDPKLALGLLQTRRGRSRRSGVITQECCSPQGCTWEEYAEYCTQNNRKVPHKRFAYV